MSSNCTYFIAVDRKERQNCPNCINWRGDRCKCEDLLLRDNKTDLVHGHFIGMGRSRGVRSVFH